MKLDISTVHPELRPIAQKMPAYSFSRGNLWVLRFLTNLQPGSKTAKDIRIENIFIPCPDRKSKIRLRIYTPQTIHVPAPALIWLHGGGYIIGKPEMDDAYCIQFARELGIVVVSVDYRSAPEHPFPAPLEDCYAALEWMNSHAAQFGMDAMRIAIGGESAGAGAGLAAALVQLAHDRNAIKLIFQLLIYPMLDDLSAIRTDIVHQGEFV